MARQLLTTRQVENRLGIGHTKFYELRAKLIAKGLKTARVGKRTKYLESSLDQIIDRAINTDMPIC